MDNIAVIAQAVATIVVAIGTILTAILSYKSQQASKAAKEASTANTEAIEVVRLDVNDKMKKYIDTAERAKFAQGKLEGAESERLAELNRKAVTRTEADEKGSAKDPIHVKLADDEIA